LNPMSSRDVTNSIDMQPSTMPSYEEKRHSIPSKSKTAQNRYDKITEETPYKN
jgi:hypothetical protein